MNDISMLNSSDHTKKKQSHYAQQHCSLYNIALYNRFSSGVWAIQAYNTALKTYVLRKARKETQAKYMLCKR